MVAAARGVVSRSTARAGGRSSRLATRSPVTISPPRERSSAARASVTAADPPRTIGQPTAWAYVPSTSPNEADNGRSSRTIECAASAPNSARAGSPRKRPRARPSADRSAGSPNRARASGWRGTWTTGRAAPCDSFRASRTSGPNSRRQAPPSSVRRSRSRPAAVTVNERSSTAARPPSSGMGERRVRDG